MRPSCFPWVKVPIPYNSEDCKKYQYEKSFEYTDNSKKSFKFRYDIYYPTGVVFNNRRTHCVFVGYFKKRGILLPDTFYGTLKLIAYPSSIGKNDGFGYSATFSFESFKVNTDVVNYGKALAEDLQYFIDSNEIYYSTVEKEKDKYEVYTADRRIMTKIEWRQAEEGKIPFDYNCLTRYNLDEMLKKLP